MNPTIFIWASPFGSGSSFQVLVLRRGCFDTPLLGRNLRFARLLSGLSTSIPDAFRKLFNRQLI